MAKFCPECGNEMSDNAKFCMGCGAKLGDYSSGGVNIQDGFIQRSQIGAASVGNINISPKISATMQVGRKDICPKCGFTMQELIETTQHQISANGITTVLTMIHGKSGGFYKYTDAYICPKCKYKCIYSLRTMNYDWSVYIHSCPKCGNELGLKGGILFTPTYEYCKKCGWQGKKGEADKQWSKAVPLKRALQLAGYDVLT